MDLKPFIIPSSDDNDKESASDNSNSASTSTTSSNLDTKSSKNSATTISNAESRNRALRFSLSCSTSSKVENKLLGFFWVSSTLLVLVSKTMIELFQFNPRCLLTDAPSKRAASSSSSSNAPMSKIREIALPVSWWSYAASTRILVVATDPSGTKLSPFYFSSQSAANWDATALPPFKVDLKMVDKIAKGDLYIRPIYGLVFCIFINSNTKELVLYQLRPEGAVLYITITNLPNGPIRLSFVDNMILAHSLTLNITAVYDIRYRPKQARSIDHPITPPLPITRPLDVGLPSNSISQSPEHSTFDDILPSPRSNLFPSNTETPISEHQLQSPLKGSSATSTSPITSPKTHVTSSAINVTPKKSSADSFDQASDILSTSVVSLNIAPNGTSTSMSSLSITSVAPSSPSSSAANEQDVDFDRQFSYHVVQYLLPEFAVNRLNGQIYRLSLHLEGFAAAFRDQVRLCHFLMHRDSSKLILLSLVRRMIIHRSDMRVISEVLDLFTGTLQTYHEEQKMMQVLPTARAGTGSSASPNAMSSARNITSASPKRSSGEDISGSPIPRPGTPTSASTSRSVLTSSNSSLNGPSSTSASSSSSKRGSSTDPWFFRRAEQYVTAFKKSKGSSTSSQAASGAVVGSPATSSLNHAPGSASGSQLNGTGNGNNGASVSTPSSGTTSPEIMSPNSSMGALPTPEEIGLDLSGTSSPGVGGSLAFSSVSASLVDPTQIRTRSRNVLVVTQQDMYTQVFLPLEERGVPWKTLICVLTTYVTSLTQRAQLPVDTDIYGFMIDLLVRNKQYYQLHQFLQLRVIADSLHVACQLMYLSSTYPPATQLGLDMFKRLKEHAYTIESLLSRGMVLIALRFLKTVRWTAHEAQSLVPRFLQEAKFSGDMTLFYVTYTFFAQRNEIFTGICDEYVRFFQSEFEAPPAVLPTV